MTSEHLQLLFDYGYWANERLFHVISQLAAEEFTFTCTGGSGE